MTENNAQAAMGAKMAECDGHKSFGVCWGTCGLALDAVSLSETWVSVLNGKLTH